MSNKYIKVMADYCSTGLWNDEGECIRAEDFLLSLDTIRKLEAWCSAYEKSPGYWSNDEEWSDEEYVDAVNKISDDGYLIALAIQEDLPTFQIDYMSERTLKLIRITKEMVEGKEKGKGNIS